MEKARLAAYAATMPGLAIIDGKNGPRIKREKIPKSPPAEIEEPKTEGLSRQQRRYAERMARKARRSRLRLHGGWKVRYMPEYYE